MEVELFVKICRYYFVLFGDESTLLLTNNRTTKSIANVLKLIGLLGNISSIFGAVIHFLCFLILFFLYFWFYVLGFFKIFLGSKIFNSWAFGEGSMFQWFYWWIIGNISSGTAGICYNVLWLLCTMNFNFALSDLYFDINRLLWFQDYHRFHFPVSGTIQKIVNIPGCLYTVCDCRW